MTVTYQQLEPSAPPKTPEELGWPAGFFEQTYGSCQDDPIVIDYDIFSITSSLI
ncbi:MAG: hypothetical protein RM022_030460 [Nostoc sp. EfeVER01]|uniref:hypothetical protein n=1 Tax=unclassified Nostoc TaxID=2593658 RepID=UPI002AD57F8E|nr:MULTISPECIES: hypothetical protein [unclassified Nostoc]MDZ7943444.1 hypothetical protein [Nostoc sp. EfeVER01]MDZ7996261.1 hypothetical protein [Nostoc sp. EspVER01]